MLDVDFYPHAAAAAHLGRGTRQAGGAHILDADERAGVHDLETRVAQQLLGEGIPYLNGWPLFLRLFVEFGRCHRGAMNAVAACFGADVIDGVALATRGALDDVLVTR